MLALITGTTLVQGVSGKTVEYIGCVQEDGYVYFNDNRFYRCATPLNMSATVEVDGSSVQMWYTQQNRWIRCNVFDTIKLKGFDSDAITQSINTALTDALQAIQDAAGAASGANNALSKTLDNGDVLLTTVNTLNSIIAFINQQHQQSFQQIIANVWHN